MINLEELIKTSLVQILSEIEYTNKLLDGIDLLIDSGKMQPHIRTKLINELNKLEKYYKTLEQEVIRRGWANENDLSRKMR